MIRKGRPDDLEALADLCVDFYKESQGKDVDASVFHPAIVRLIVDGIVFVSEDDGIIRGMIMLQYAHNGIDGGHFIQEIVWYARDNSGFKLLNRARKVGKEKGLVIYMTVLEGAGPRVHDYLARISTPIERSYMMK